jgi:hypothetical protein
MQVFGDGEHHRDQLLIICLDLQCLIHRIKDSAWLLSTRKKKVRVDVHLTEQIVWSPNSGNSTNSDA